MTELVACLSTGKGTWGHVSRLIQEVKWDKVYLLTNEYGKENFSKDDKTEFIVVNADQGLRELRDEIQNKLKGLIKGTEVAVNFISGSGKEHMALMAALLKLGIGMRFMALTKEGVQEL
jgi:Na+-transporting NADH:ubiquinone oxidoreductase subunit NqrF